MTEARMPSRLAVATPRMASVARMAPSIGIYLSCSAGMSYSLITMVCTRLAVLFFTLVSGSLSAAAQDIYTVNLTEIAQDGTAYFLVFSAYGESITGHMDVGWGKESPALL